MWVFLYIKQIRYIMLFNELYSYWEMDFVTLGQSQLFLSVVIVILPLMAFLNPVQSSPHIASRSLWTPCPLFPLPLRPSVSPSGDSDPHPRHGGDPGLVPADPREAAGPEHHGPGLQQHRSHAGRVLPCLQDRVLSFMGLAGPPPYPSHPPPSLSSGGRGESEQPSLFLQSFSISHGTSLKHIRRSPQFIRFCLAEVWFMLSVTVGLSRE